MQTLDVDTNDCWTVDKLFWKIMQCPKLKNARLKESWGKGMHFILFCDDNCLICRMCYDDSERFRRDMQRPKYLRNVLWDRKEVKCLSLK